MTDGGMAGPSTPRAEWRTALRVIRKAGDWSGYVAEALGITGLSIGICLQLWDVLSRNLGFGSLDEPWVLDGSSLALVLGALVYVAATRRHIGFVGLPDLINNKTLKRRMQAITNPIVAALLIFLAYYGIQLVTSQVQFGGSYSTSFWSPLWLFYAAFPVTCILAAIRWITRNLGRQQDEEDADLGGPRGDDIEVGAPDTGQIEQGGQTGRVAGAELQRQGDGESEAPTPGSLRARLSLRYSWPGRAERASPPRRGRR